MTQERAATISVWIFILIVVVLIALHLKARIELSREIRIIESHRQYLIAKLQAIKANDCIVEQTHYGWSCTTSKGEVYKIRR
jgi:hypothetical protein